MSFQVRTPWLKAVSVVAIDPLGGLYWPEGEDLAPDGLDRYRDSAD